MLNRIVEFPLTDIDIDNQRRGQLLNTLLVGIGIIALFILVLLIGTSFVGIAIQNKPVLYIITLASIISIVFIYWLNQKGKVLLSGVLFLVLLTVAISFADTPSELLAGRSLFFFIIPIMMASFLLRSYASFITAGFLAAEHLLLWAFLDLQINFNMFGMVAFFIFALITWLAADTLEKALDEAREINQNLDRIVGERTAELAEANAYLEISNERLKELDILKSKFVSDVSHELRTPISNISIYLEMLDKILKKIGQTLPEKVGKFIGIARQETERLGSLINDILDSSRREQSMANPEKQPVDVHALIQEVIEANRLNIESKGLELDVALAPMTPSLLADPKQLKQVFTNLVANAVNYTQQGSVRISTITRNDTFTFIIQDTGMGIASNDIPHLFERFYRGEQASRSSIPGTGLGLAITKEIIELHQGDIEVQSEINVGTSFVVTFPIHKIESE